MAKEIQLTRPRNANYTPRSLMYDYAKAHEPSVQFHFGVPPQLIIGGVRYGYDHWDITHVDDHTDRVTLYLIPE